MRSRHRRQGHLIYSAGRLPSPVPLLEGDPTNDGCIAVGIVEVVTSVINCLLGSVGRVQKREALEMKACKCGKQLGLSAALLGLVLIGSAFAQDKPTGPFGFERGMTRAQIIQLVGEDAVDIKHSHDNTLRLKTAPKPNPAFESYLLFISPTQGLLKLVASGTTVQTGDSGAELQTVFDAVVTGVSQKYGNPSKKMDFCNGGTGCTGSEYWMLSLMEKNRHISTLWDFEKQPVNSITCIGVDISALSLNSGWVTVAYEFEGWSQFVDSRLAKQNDSY